MYITVNVLISMQICKSYFGLYKLTFALRVIQLYLCGMGMLWFNSNINVILLFYERVYFEYEIKGVMDPNGKFGKASWLVLVFCLKYKLGVRD